MNTSPRDSYQYGKSTLQGGLTQEEVVSEIYTFQIPDLQVENIPGIYNVSTTVLPSEHTFGEELKFVDTDGTEIVYGRDWGANIPTNSVLIDNYNVLKDSIAVFGEYQSVDLTNAYLTIGEGENKRVVDNRLGDFRMSFNIGLEQNAIGSRTLAFMGWIWEPEIFRVNYYEPLWAQTFVPATDGTSQFHIETQRFGFNLLELRRKAIAATKYPDPKENLRMSIAFFLHQSSSTELRVTGANLWIKKVNELIDADRFRGTN